MRIVHVITSLERGGAQAILETLVIALKEQGHEQAVIYFHDGPYKDRLQQLSIDLYQVKGLASSWDPVAYYRLSKIIKQLKPDLIHALLWTANLMARLVGKKLGIPVVMVLHNNLAQNGFLRNSIDCLVSYDGHTIVAVSAEVSNSFYRYQKRVPITIIENGIDSDLVRSITPIQRADIGLTDQHMVIGSVGRFVSLKRYPLLFDVMALLLPTMPHLRLVLVGAGPQESYLRDYAKKIGIDHAITWIIDKPAVAYYPIFDLFIMTSAREGISMALLEAMSWGISPLVTAENSTHPVITDGKNGFVARGKNATDIALAVGVLVRDDLLRKRAGRAAQQEVQIRFSKNRMIAAYLALFDDIVHQKREGSL